MPYKFILLLLMFFRLFPTQAQDSLVCITSNSIVANSKFTTFYIGLDNPLFISYHLEKKFIVKCDKGKITKRNDQYYLGNLMEPGICTITLTDLKGRNEERFNFRIRHLPAPTATIANQKTNTEINKALLKMGCIIPVLENFDFELFFKVISYKVLITRPNKELLNFSVQGSCLTQEVKDCIQNLQKGDTVVFYTIKCKLDNINDLPGQEILPINLTIK